MERHGFTETYNDRCRNKIKFDPDRRNRRRGEHKWICRYNPACADWAWWILMLVPVVIGFLYVRSYGVNVMWEDQGDGMLPLFQKWFEGHLSLADFWHQHNEHRHFIPRLIMFGLGLLTRWNTVAEMYLDEVFLALCLAVHVFAMRRTLPLRNYKWLLLPIPWVVFTLRQYQNLLVGFQMSFVLVILLICLTFYALATMEASARSGARFAAAIVFATLSAYTAAQGLLVWWVGVIPLVLQKRPAKEKIVLTIAWLGIGVIEWVIYFVGWSRPEKHPPYIFSGEYFATLLGASLYPMNLELSAPTIWLALVAGVMIILCLLAAAGVLAMGRNWSDYSYWIAIIAFSGLTAIQITFARSAFGPMQAMSSRYATASCLALLGAFGILTGKLAEKAWPPLTACWGYLLCLISFGTALALVEGYLIGPQLRDEMNYQAYVFATADTQPDEVVQRAAGPRAPEVREGLKFLQKSHLNVFSSPELTERYALPSAETPVLQTAAKFDLNQFGASRGSSVFNAVGWAVDPTGTDTVGGVFLDIDGQMYPTFYGVARDDIAAGLKNDNVRHAGSSEHSR